MSTNSIPFIPSVNPSNSGHMTRPSTEPHPAVQTVTDLVQELTQLPIRSLDDHEDLDHIRYIGRSIAQYLHHLGYELTAAVDTTGDVPRPRYRSHEVTQPLSSSETNYADNPQTDQPTSVLNRQTIAPDRGANGHSAVIQATIEPDRDQQGCRRWCELGDFFVSFGFAIDETGKKRFQTRVHHSQADQSAQWPGLAIGQLLTWMLRQTNLLLPAEDTVAPSDRVQSLPAPAMTSGPAESQIINPSPQKSSQTFSIQSLPHKPKPIQCQRTQLSSASFVNFLMILYAVVRLKKRRT